MMLHSEPENIRLIERPEVQSAFEWQRATAVRCARPGMMFSWKPGESHWIRIDFARGTVTFDDLCTKCKFEVSISLIKSVFLIKTYNQHFTFYHHVRHST
jgi:hypothetical protein